jgi:hypothetical protein
MPLFPVNTPRHFGARVCESTNFKLAESGAFLSLLQQGEAARLLDESAMDAQASLSSSRSANSGTVLTDREIADLQSGTLSWEDTERLLEREAKNQLIVGDWADCERTSTGDVLCRPSLMSTMDQSNYAIISNQLWYLSRNERSELANALFSLNIDVKRNSIDLLAAARSCVSNENATCTMTELANFISDKLKIKKTG